jgi:hypothetical protein
MDSSETTKTTPPPPDAPFKKWTDCSKALKQLAVPASDEERNAFEARILQSGQKLQIAFEFLWWIQGVKGAGRYRWLEPLMLQLLGGGAEEPRLTALPTPADAGKWVFEELKDVNTSTEWKSYVASGRHLWLLHVILKARTNKPTLVEALLALTECIAHYQSTTAEGKPKKTKVQPEESQWIARLLKARIPAKLDLPKGFNETLFALNSTASLSEDLRSESNGLRSQLERVQAALKEEEAAHAETGRREEKLKTELDNERSELQKVRKELEEEKMHTIRSGGFGGVAKRETVNQVLSDVRRGVVSRLENIRRYADREKPDGGEIVELVSEIERHLAGVEERIKS